MVKIEQDSYEKGKIRSKTLKYFNKYCDLERKCQICGAKAEIHHPNYKDYLKINLLCRKHHTDVHKFRIAQPSLIDLENVPKKKQCKTSEDIIVKNINEKSKIKANYVLSCKGKDLSKAVREMVDQLAEEFDEMKK